MIEKRLQGDYQHVHFDSSGENLCIGAGDMGMRLNIFLNRLHHHPNAIPEWMRNLLTTKETDFSILGMAAWGRVPMMCVRRPLKTDYYLCEISLLMLGCNLLLSLWKFPRCWQHEKGQQKWNMHTPFAKVQKRGGPHINKKKIASLVWIERLLRREMGKFNLLMDYKNIFKWYEIHAQIIFSPGSGKIFHIFAHFQILSDHFAITTIPF